MYESDPAVANSHPRRFTALNYTDALKVAGKLIQPKAVTYLQKHQARAEVAALARPYQSVVHGGDTELSGGVPSTPCNVVILGLGTVGFGVYQRLLKFPELFRVLGVLVRDRAKHEDVGVPSGLLHTSIDSLRGLRPSLVIDALPGREVSASLLEHYLSSSVDVVSANKAVIASRGPSLARIARDSSALLCYSAAVGGSTSMLEAVSRSVARREIESIAAVLNGTCNFVLDACAQGASLKDAVAEAQQRGFAEADPSEDLSGRDAGRKLKILARHAFDAELEAIPFQALDESIARAARGAAQSGMKLRQVARAARLNGHIAAAVQFEEAQSGSLFGELTGEWNGLELRDANGRTVPIRGRGAGRWPTAEAVMADVFEITRDRARAT